jgi:hypothetical protein
VTMSPRISSADSLPADLDEKMTRETEQKPTKKKGRGHKGDDDGKGGLKNYFVCYCQ